MPLENKPKEISVSILYRAIIRRVKRNTLRIFISGILILLFILFLRLDPLSHLKFPYGTVLFDQKGELLGATLSSDFQWRFPPPDSLPLNYEKALLLYEDKRFYSHWGVDGRALARALRDNLREREIVSGASTLTMQVIRLSRGGKSRTLIEKCIEIILALRLELQCSKEEILKIYTSIAPYGGNIQGISAASWRYFERNLTELSWAESSLLAVLPNAPALIHPGKNRNLLKKKRDLLLEKLYKAGEMDSLSFQLALKEPLPDKPKSVPKIAPHLLEFLSKKHKGNLSSTLDKSLQKRASEIVLRHQKELAGNGIYNACALILRTETGEVLAYIGNSGIADSIGEHGTDVDIIPANRSTGSILKPFLYASMLSEGELLPHTLIPDIPTHIAGFRPQNYERGFDGAIPASQALSRSLNVPAVKMLQVHGIQKFQDRLKALGITSLKYPSEHYGLTMILGGAEASLWELCSVYASMGRILIHYPAYHGKYDPADLHPARILSDSVQPIKNSLPTNHFEESGILSAASIWFCFEAMAEVNRPELELFWKQFSSKKKIAWKTGTSYGNRDAWAIGMNRDVIIGVWVGNADGEGRPLLTGLSCAAPILFDLSDLFPQGRWFDPPYDEMVRIPVCRQSGYRASSICFPVDTAWVQASGLQTTACPYHRIIHLNKKRTHRVSLHCSDAGDIVSTEWFILPPAMEWYYRKKNAFYRNLPPWRKDCMPETDIVSMELIYPRTESKIYIPLELSGEKGEVIFEAVHRNQNAKIFWHLDEEFLGCTSQFHKVKLRPKAGLHTITLVDDQGESLRKSFEIIDKD